MDEDGNKDGVVQVRQLHNTPVIIEGVQGVATWDEAGGRLCFVPNTDSPGYRAVATRDGGEWSQWVIENEVRIIGNLLVVEIVE